MRRLRTALLVFASSGFLFLSCPSGTLEFLAPSIQPIVGDLLAQVADLLTEDLLGSQ